MPKRPNPYRGYRFPGEVIAHAVRLSLRSARSYREVEDLLAERGITVSAAAYRATRHGRVAPWQEGTGLRAG